MNYNDALEESIDIDLRSPQLVARRCIILAAVVQSFSINIMPENDPFGAAFDLREWLRGECIWAETTQAERELLTRPPDSSEPEGSLDIALVAESLAAVAWALGLLPSLPDDHLATLASLIDEIPAPWDATAPWIAKQILLSESDIAQMRELSEVWHWRLGIEPDRRAANDRERAEIEHLIQTVIQDAISADLLAPGEVSEFTLDGISVSAMLPSKIAEQQLLSEQRLFALNWICGFGDDWDNVPIDV